MKKCVPKWIREIAIFCGISEQTDDLFFSFDTQIFDGYLNVQGWKELIDNTWFVLQGDRHKSWWIVFEADSEQECRVKAGEVLSARELVNLILSDDGYAIRRSESGRDY